MGQLLADKQLHHHERGALGFRQREGGTNEGILIMQGSRKCSNSSRHTTTKSHVYQTEESTRRIKENVRVAFSEDKTLAQRDITANE